MSAPFSNLAPYEGLQPLLALSGMAYHGGMNTAEEWKAKTGHDPRQFRQWFYVSPVNQFCFLTDKGRQTLQAHHNAVRLNWHALGVGN